MVDRFIGDADAQQLENGTRGQRCALGTAGTRRCEQRRRGLTWTTTWNKGDGRRVDQQVSVFCAAYPIA